MKLRITYYAEPVGQIHDTLVTVDEDWETLGPAGARQLVCTPSPGDYVPPEDWILCVEPA